MSTKASTENFLFSEDWIIFQDDDILVVNKPSGLLSVPGRLTDPSFCLVGRLPDNLQHCLIVHRLDMDTSGIMILAKHKDAHKHLSMQFQNRETQKHYHALISGYPSCHQGQTMLPMRCDWENRPLQMIDFTHGKTARTLWSIEETHRIPQTNTFYSLVKLTPITGRSHQLRLHMKMLGHPILGDNLYSDNLSYQLTKRLCLHATELTIQHPATHATLTFNQPINLNEYINPILNGTNHA
ncbi:RluA family pseudouridine synthase [Thiosulfativibrio zosterae]|uniref:Dual-specificity RNA pseudouridine synthase RluA n=1 Tax=Thiosulfativibrio zosterae TaxID=2675053 RepID=A0A6F8PP96_9GAMM|nr:RluA family pseudouridine synthase [Thiosulfativibrio zosterae]BBP43925.1 ribosomal large subunit pseudouridine synthase A [Thiosulfativibrio zosterae]